MKKREFIISILFLISCSQIYSVSKLPQPLDKIFVYFHAPNKSAVCSFEFDFKTLKSTIELGSSGYDLIHCRTINTSEGMEVSFIQIWNGAEEFKRNDIRWLLYYKVFISKKQIKNSNNGNLAPIKNVIPILILKDTSGSVERHHDDFIYDSVKEIRKNFYQLSSVTNILQDTDKKSKSLKIISTEHKFFILDVLCSKKSVDDIFLKIDCEGTQGYIPLSFLADNWTVVENHLGEGVFSNPEANDEVKPVTQNAVTKQSAVLNDTRVRLRVKPNLSCQTVTHLNKGDKVKITDRSDEIFEIDGESWYWYKVETTDLKNGWVYGKYLDIEK